MKEIGKFRIWELALLIALCVSSFAGLWAERTQSQLRSQMVRLHVLAVDDSQLEQNIKLGVRDAVLDYLEPVLAQVSTAGEARKTISSQLDRIRLHAAMASQGRSVQVTLSEEYYPTRTYEGFSLPAGKYQSLRVVLGEGRGHNWWCVVYPQLCLPAAAEYTPMEALPETTAQLIAGGDSVQYKFRILELWGRLQAYLEA